MTARYATPWTEDDARRLRELYMGGASNAEIAAQLGRTATAVRNRASEMCLPRRPIFRAPPLQWPPVPAGAEQPAPPAQWQPTPLRQARPSPKERACMTCTKPFLSEGPHNRMCGSCRQLSQPF